MRRFLKWLLKSMFLLLCGVVVCTALILGGCKFIRFVSSAPASLDSIDPWERAEAARALAKKYGGAK